MFAARRDEILKRYGVPPGTHPNYEIDHLIPLCLGGSDDPPNLYAGVLGISLASIFLVYTGASWARNLAAVHAKKISEAVQSLRLVGAVGIEPTTSPV